MRRRRKIRRRINIKRFSITMTVLMVLLILTTKISLKYAAKGNDIEKKSISEEAPVIKEVEKESEEETVKETEETEEKEENAEDITEIKIEVEEEKKSEEKAKEENAEGSKGSSEYNEIFGKDLFIGDSITDSLSFYGLIDEANVFAKLGFTAKKAQNEIDEIVNKSPENIYMMFGMNDMLTFRETEKVTKYYGELVDGIHKKLPDANIYIQSILPVKPEVKNKQPFLTNENIDKFNQALSKMAEEKNLQYINTREIVEDNMDLFEPDGIHMKYKFYKLWLDYLIDKTK